MNLTLACGFIFKGHSTRQYYDAVMGSIHPSNACYTALYAERMFSTHTKFPTFEL